MPSNRGSDILIVKTRVWMYTAQSDSTHLRGHITQNNNNFALHTGYVSTLLKRRRWLPHIKSHDYAQRSQAERQAVNFVVQGWCNQTVFVVIVRGQRGLAISKC